MIRISVIIVSHGHEAMLPDCLTSLHLALRGLDSEIILLDNFAAGTAEHLLRPSFPDLIYITNAAPAGFSRNVNRAAARATGKYLLFLNPDTTYSSGSLAEALDYLDEHPSAALLGCRLINEDGTRQQNYRRFPTLPVIVCRALGADHWRWQPRFYRWRMMLDTPLDRPTPVDWVFGAFMLLRRDLFEAVGGMDPKFNLYYEDVDLCYRLREQNMTTCFYPGVQFTHSHLRSSARNPFGQAWRWHLRSAFRILYKHGYLLRPPVDAQPG